MIRVSEFGGILRYSTQARAFNSNLLSLAALREKSGDLSGGIITERMRFLKGSGVALCLLPVHFIEWVQVKDDPRTILPQCRIE